MQGMYLVQLRFNFTRFLGYWSCAGHHWKVSQALKSQSCPWVIYLSNDSRPLLLSFKQIPLCQRKCGKNLYTVLRRVNLRHRKKSANLRFTTLNWATPRPLNWLHFEVNLITIDFSKNLTTIDQCFSGRKLFCWKYPRAFETWPVIRGRIFVRRYVTFLQLKSTILRTVRNHCVRKASWGKHKFSPCNVDIADIWWLYIKKYFGCYDALSYWISSLHDKQQKLDINLLCYLIYLTLRMTNMVWFMLKL